MSKKHIINVNRDTYFLTVIIILFIISMLLYLHFSYENDFIKGKTMSFMERWTHTNEFHIEHGFWLIPMGLLIVSILIWLMPEVNPNDTFKIAKNYLIWKFREGKKEYSEYRNKH